MYFSTFNMYSDNLWQYNAEDSNVCLVCWEDKGYCYSFMDFKQSYNYETNCECNGIFHIACIEKWVKMHNSCPICREQIKDDISITCFIIAESFLIVINICRKIFLIFELLMAFMFINFIILFYTDDTKLPIGI